MRQSPETESEMSERADSLPSSLAYEQGVLGAALWSDAGLLAVLDRFREEDFYAAEHRAVFVTLRQMHGAGLPVTIGLLATHLTRSGQLADVGGDTYLLRLHDAAVPTTALDECAAQLRAAATARKTISAANRMRTEAAESQGEPEKVEAVVAAAHETVQELAENLAPPEWVSAETLVDRAVSSADGAGEREQIIPTGFGDLDGMLGGGLRGGQVAIVAARPGGGKSTLAMDVARHVAIREQQAVLFFSLEMSLLEMGRRLLSAEARVPHSHLLSQEVTDDEWRRIFDTVGRLDGVPLHVAATADLDVERLTAMARAAIRRHGCVLVIVDYLQLLTPAQQRGGYMPREQVVSEFSRGLKKLALSEDIAILEVSQLNRGPEQRHDKRPHLSDLRETGTLEQDSDIALLMHREDMYDPDTPRLGETDIDVAKQRNGPTGSVTVATQHHFSRHVGFDETHESYRYREGGRNEHGQRDGGNGRRNGAVVTTATGDAAVSASWET